MLLPVALRCVPTLLQAQKHLEETRKAKADAEALRRECATAQDEVAKLKRQVKKLQRDNESLKQLETNITHYYRNNRSQRQHGAPMAGSNGASVAGSVAGSVRGGASVVEDGASVRDAGAASTHTQARDGSVEAGNALQWARAQLAAGGPAQHGSGHQLQSVQVTNLQTAQQPPQAHPQQGHQQQAHQQQHVPSQGRGIQGGGSGGGGTGGGDENDATIRRVNAMIAAKRAGRPMSAGQRSTGSGGSSGSGRRTSWGGSGMDSGGGGVRQPVRSHPLSHLDETPGPIQTAPSGEPTAVHPAGGVCSTEDPKTPLPHLGPGGVTGAHGGAGHAHPHRQRLLAQQHAAQQAYDERQAQMQMIRQRMEEEEASRGQGTDDAYDYSIPAMQSQLQDQFYQRAQEQHMAQRQQRWAQQEAAAAAHAKQPGSARSNGSASTNASARFSTARAKQRRASRPAGGGAAAVAAARRSRKQR